jgi:uncharacterized membrane protein
MDVPGHTACVRRPILVALVLLGSLLVFAEGTARELKADPQTGKLRVLYMGDALGIRGPFPYMRMEPSFVTTPVEACTFHSTPEFIKKQMRAYMPRTESRLREDYDVLILSDANRGVFSPRDINWFSQAVVEDGLGLIMIGGAESYEGRAGGVAPSWGITTVADVLPVNMIADEYCDESMKMVIVDQEAELATTLPWKTLGNKGIFGEGHKVTLKQTAQLLAEADTFSYGRLPHLIWHDVGNGRGFSMTTDWTPAGGAIFMTWNYYPDFVLNVVMFTAGRKLPEDVDVVYTIRRRIRDYADIRGTLNSMIEIVDKFGGNFALVEKMARDCDEAKAGADGLYFQGEYASALESYDLVIGMVNDNVAEAREVARRALFYVYLIEWASVTGTFMISGFLVYTLMIRRKMYVEVRTTRLDRYDE